MLCTFSISFLVFSSFHVSLTQYSYVSVEEEAHGEVEEKAPKDETEMISILPDCYLLCHMLASSGLLILRFGWEGKLLSRHSLAVLF